MRNVYHYLLLTLFSIGVSNALAQNPTIQDCLGAIPICQQIYVENASPTGSGNFPNEINTSINCTAGELNSIWYTFTVNQSGNFGFLLTPMNITDDYDWSLFNITNASCGDIDNNQSLMVSCNAAGGGTCNGLTGATGGTTYNVQGAGCNANPPSQTMGFSAFNSLIPVIVGNTYVLMVSNWTGSPNGYTIDFGLTSVGVFGANNPPIIPGNIMGPMNVCPGGVFNYSVNPAVGASNYNWTLTPAIGGISNNGSNNISITFAQAGVAQLCVTPSNPCVIGPPKCKTIIVTPIPPTFHFINYCFGDTWTCEGQTFSFPGQQSFLYDSWLGCDSSVICVATAIPPIVMPPQQAAICQGQSYNFAGNTYNATGGYPVTLQAANGCDSVVTLILSVMQADAVIAPPGLLGCGGASTLILDGSGSTTTPAASGAVLTYLWTGPGIVGPNNLLIATINQPGTYTLTVTQTFMGVTCTDQASVTVTANVAVPNQPTVSGPLSPCTGGTSTYTVTPPASGPAPTGYTWTVTGGTFTTSGNTITVTWTAAGAGQVCVTANNACGPGPAACLAITVGQGPAVPTLTGPATVCEGDVINYVINPVDPSTTSYTWTVGGNASFTDLGSSIQVDFSGAVDGQICVTGTNACGTSAQACIAVTVDDVPAQPVIAGVASVCNGEIANYSVPLDPNATSYTWTVPAGATITAGQGTNAIVINWTGGASGNVCVRAINACGQSPQACFAVSVNAAPTATLSGGGSYCAGSPQNFNLSIDLTGASPWDIVYAIDGLPQAPITGVVTDPFILTVSAPGVYTLVSLDNIAPCPGLVSGTATITENPLPSAVLSGSGSICQGSGDCIGLSVLLTGTPPWSLTFTLNGTPQAPITGIVTNPFAFDACQGGTYAISQVTDGNGCVETGAGSSVVGVNTAVTVSNIQVTCNATSTGYTVSFTINGGDPGSYTVDGSAAGIVAGVYTSAEIPSGSGYSFVVDDANSCGPVTVSQAIVLCNCITSVGDMDPTEQTECGVACITATYDATGEALDGDDALQFILHTGSGLAIVGEIARNVVPTFCFDALAGMTFGTTYYISAVVGNDLGGGLVDLADPCLAVAQGTPIVFYEVPTGDLTGDATICIGNGTDLTVTFTGPGPYSLSYDDGSGIATVINGINTNPYIFTVSPTVTTTYCLTDVSNAECAGLPTGCATVTVNTEVAVSNIGIACNATNTAFEVSFEITGGDAGTYTVLPLGSGTLTGGSFVSNPIAAGGTYSFQVTDINGCAVIVVEDPSPVICNCSSAVGQMDLALIEECGDGPVTATYNVLGQNFDGDDLLEFVLHTGSGNTLEYPLIARSATPSFSFDPGTMSYGTTYYISAIVGSDDGAGSVNDLADPCMAVAPGTPVIFHLVPTAVLSGTQDICLGDNAVLPIVLTGDAPWSVTVSDGTTSLTQSGINSTNYNFVIPAPATSGTYTITAMNDEHCTGPISGTATVTVNVAPVNDVPVVTINSTNTGYVVCFNISGGEAPYTVTDGVNMWTTNGPFCSDELPCGSGYNFSYDDPNGCGPVVVAEPLVECDCTTSVGQLDPAAQEICGQGPAVVAYDATGQVLDGDDVVDFILHNGNQVPILTSTVASFTYSGLLTYGVTYFISARVGNNDGNGGVDPLDPCLAITPGTPVVFYEIPSATLSGGGDFCAGDQVDLTVTIAGGTAPWEITYTNTQNQQATISIPSSPFTFQVTPTGPTLYTLISVEDDHCIGANVVGIAPFTEQSQPFGVSPLITTDPTNTFVTICFTLAGGDPATYAVNGWPGTLTGNQFCSDPIPCDQGSYQFLIQDGFGCGIDTIAGPIICNCGSGAGIMDQNSQLVCEFQPISVPAAFAVQLDGNDALMYVLHTGNGTALGTILLTSPTPDFNYDPAILDCDETYYISSVAGDDLGGGQVDLNDDCLSVSEGTPVVFHCEPSASISGGGAICEGQSIDGVFSFTGTNPFTVVINDGTQDITLNNLDTGSEWSLSPSQTTTYTLVTVQDSTGCSNTATGSITVTVNSPVFAGTANPPLTLCSGVGQLINLAGLLTGADPGGVWTETSAAPSTGGAFNAGAGTFNTAGQAPNNYTFRYLMDGIPPCADDNETVTVIIHQLPLADAGAVQELTCDATTAQIGGSGTSTGAQFSYEWTLVGSSNVIGMQTTLSVGQAGTYQLTVINTQTGCESSDQVTVTQSIETPQPVITAEDVSCFGAADGFIQIESATGGKPPYMFALNGGAFGDQQQFTGLSGGDYLISVQDANGCETQVLVTVIEPQELTATLVANILPDGEGNFVIEWGDELDLNLQSTLPIADLDTIIWSPADLVACNDVFCSSVTVAPQEGTTFTVSIEKGPCSASDQFRILVKTPRDVFIPNIFSPNLDGQNDVFFIQAGKQIAQIRSFLVFDRWGGSVFRADNFQPNDITIGWDGYYRGKLAAIGVYAYFVEVEYVDGHVEILEGDVTLVR